jgi:hypothetical protein
MGSLLSGKTTSKVEPWKPQGTAIKKAFNEAGSLYDSKKGSSWYEGDLYAGMDPMTRTGITGMGDYATGEGRDAAGQVGGTASGILGGASGGLMDGLSRYAGAAGADPTQSNIAAAGQYANNPYLQSQIDAVGSDIRRNLGENIMPSIDRAATASGNINSSRAGIAEGIAARGANEELARSAASMRYNAYNSGLGMAEGARATNLDAMGRSADLYGSAVNTGMAGAQQGMGMTTNLLQNMIASGQISQEDAQGLMDAEFARWQGNDTRDADLLSQYYGIVGDKNWGGKTTTTSTPSLLSAGLGLASTAAGFGAFGGAKK